MAYLCEALGKAIKESGFTRQFFEQKMGLSKGYLSRILGGGVELRAEHVFEILSVLEMEPWQFFHAAFPAPPNAARDPRVEAIGDYADRPSDLVRAPETEAELDRRVRAALARILLER